LLPVGYGGRAIARVNIQSGQHHYVTPLSSETGMPARVAGTECR
jgi:hypothetical protein